MGQAMSLLRSSIATRTSEIRHYFTAKFLAALSRKTRASPSFPRKRESSPVPPPTRGCQSGASHHLRWPHAHGDLEMGCFREGFKKLLEPDVPVIAALGPIIRRPQSCIA